MHKWIPLSVAAILFSGVTIAETEIKFLNDWKWEGPAAPLLMALDKGYFEEESLAVSMEPGAGSVQAIPKVESGEFQMGSADINSLIKYRDKNPESQLKAIFVIYNAPPFAIIGRPSLGVIGPTDLEGRVLGAPKFDGAFAQWDSLVVANGIKANKVTIEDVGFPEREPKLAKGEVDAITGFSFSSFINLEANGIPVSDISLMLMSDFGLDLYGNVIIVNSKFAESNREAVKAFLRASTRGYLNTIAFPAAAIKHVLAHNQGADEKTELKRLVMAIGHHIVTDEVRENGIGGVKIARLERSIEQLAQSYEFSNRPSAADVFDEAFLPLAAKRQLDAADPLGPPVPPTDIETSGAADAAHNALTTQ